VLTTEPETEEMDAEQKSEPGTQPCGTAPIADTPIALTLKEDKTVAYAWTDADGNANFDLASLIDPSVKGGVQAAFAGDTATIMASATEEQIASKRPANWAPISKLPPTGEAAITRAHFEIKEIDKNIRRVTLDLKVKNNTNTTAGLTPKAVNVRAKLSTKDNAAVNGRNVIWENLAAGAEEEKTITIDIPKGLPDPVTFDVFLINNDGVVLAKAVAKTGPEEAPAPTPAPNAKAAVDKASGQIVVYEQVKFASGNAVIDPSSNALLDTIAKLLTENPDIARVRVEGHTDDKGVKATNDKLANDRAAAVVKYLTTTGKIDAKRLFAKGYGPGCPMVPNDNDDNRAKNRRVEFVILGEKDDPKGACRVQSKK
jgi:outer membrane protein OmpA-like peptidoglycan-associated protein